MEIRLRVGNRDYVADYRVDGVVVEEEQMVMILAFVASGAESAIQSG
jgi:hypothetical protein